MKHLNKIFSVLLTAAIAVSMLIAAVPVGAADNAWTEFKVPAMSAYTGSGLLTKGIDGALYAYTNTATANTNSLTKSTDGGRTWTSVKTPGAVAGAAVITAIATSPSEANVLYIATGTSVWKSIDSGATFAALPVGTVPTNATSLAVGLLGGSYKVFAGTSGGVFLFDEGVGLNNQFVLFGGLVAPVLDVKLSPTFNTAAGIYALTSLTGTDAEVWVSTGGAFAATPAIVASGAGTTVGEIGFSADFNVTSTPVLWVGVNGANGGIFRTTLGGTGFHLGNVLPVATIDVTGSGVFGGAVTIVAGTTAGAVYITSNAGVSGLTTAAKNLTGTGAAFVALANDYATSSTVFVLNAAAAAADESGFSVSTDKAANFAQISLLNSAIASIDGTAFAANGDIFAVTSSAIGTSLWRNAGGKWDRIQGNKALGMFAKIAVSPNYATDKGVFYVAANVINASANNGVSFTAQSFSAGTVNSYVALDNATFVVATATGIMRTTNSGFVWNSVSTANAAYLVRSSDGTAMAAVTAAGAVSLSSDLGATWGTAAGTLAGVSAVTFQNGSNTVLWGTTATGGISKIDMSATTKAWAAQPTSAALTVGVGIASGVATSPVIYALDAAGSLTRLIGDASAAENIAAATGVTAATNLFIVPAAGGNTLWAVTATKLYTFKDTIAVAVPNVAAASFTTTTANVTFGAVAGATDYAVFVKAGSTAQKDYFTATTAGTVTVDKTALTASVSGLVSNTTYTISVFAKTPYISLVGSKTFSTQPQVVDVPVNLAPAAGATGIAVTPGFAWGAVPGATSYTIEVSAVPTFATLVGTKQTTTIPAFAWTTPALANNTTYYWRVVAVTATGTSDPVISVFTTVAAQVTTPPVTIPTQPVVTPTITVEIPEETTPAYIWAIIGIGALLVIVVIVLIVRTRRVV